MATAKKVVTEKQLIKAMDDLRKQLYDNPRVSATRFDHMQAALFYAKNEIRKLHGSPTKSEMAWIK